jgi:hypothetical protein
MNRASVATIIRIIYLPGLSEKDALFVNNPAVLWSSIEVATNIICTSAMTLKPLMVKWGIVHNSLPSVSGQQYAQGRGSEHHHSLPIQPSNDVKWPAPQGWAVRNEPNASTQMILYAEEPRTGRRPDKDERIQGAYHV